ncbi:UDP-glucose 4-epimerase GalE [Pigmentiphaga sp. D-2]|uniref:UDP-glucose 4-epimerase GalE n=1 Tax=Pigmentiphaga sp. D-2 TaxID=1002116 RepID=UPI00104632A7|nr:UDP-glucose 4-epimerase GalE [Pigmentiphaga sp. D-2]
MTKTLLVTGGAGYIGSHVVVELVRAGYCPVIVDNFCNSSPRAIQRVEHLVGQAIPVVRADVRDSTAMLRVFKDAQDSGQPISGVIHLAGLKAVGESVTKPLTYYENNVYGTVKLLDAMDQAGVASIVFSSSATIYGAPEHLPYTEGHRVSPVNPYGHSKAICEQVLKDWSICGGGRRAVALRYFNPIGADHSGLIGEDPRGVPNNLFPYITQVAVGRRQYLTLHGNDYKTPDGTGVRDYIHVTDLAVGHVRAVEFTQNQQGFTAVNLGTGQGTSVLQLVEAFEKATGQQILCKIGPRRQGDIAGAWADVSLARELLGWKAQRTITEMCADGWRWQSMNPEGYGQEV